MLLTILTCTYLSKKNIYLINQFDYFINQDNKKSLKIYFT
jgi:hypothetical protein